MFLAPREKHDAVRAAMGDMVEMRVNFEAQGSRVLSTFAP